MSDIGLQDLPPDVIAALRRVASFSMGKEGRVYVRFDRASIEREDLLELVACPLLARIMAGSSLLLIFDPDLAAVADRERKRAVMMAELAAVAPEVAADISREISG